MPPTSKMLRHARDWCYTHILMFQDNRNFVDQSLFYTCCPYIGELKTLLVDFTVGYGSKASAIRKITPISADVPVKKSLNERQLQVSVITSSLVTKVDS